MSGILSSLNSGRTSLQTAQKAMEVIGNNIANVNTEGYSRQVPILTPVPSLDFAGYTIGLGVRVSGVDREYDGLLVRQIQNKSIEVGERSASSTALAEIERVLGISERSLSSQIDAFFDSWQQLSTNPAGVVERDQIMQQGARLAEAFRSSVTDLGVVRDNLAGNIASKVDEVNLMLREVQDLNTRIAAIETAGQMANGPRDRRDLVLEQLSMALGITYLEEGNQVSIQLPGGTPLLSGAYVGTIEGNIAGNDYELRLQAGATTLSLGLEHIGGELKGLMNTREEFIPAAVADIDTLAYELVNAVNTQHAGGIDRYGNPGADFFTAPAQLDGAAFSMAMALTDGRQIAAGVSSAPGDNANALSMADLPRQKLIGGTDTFNEFYGKTVARVGLEAAHNNLVLQGAEDALVQLKNLRDAKSGVSIEEEMISLMQFQRSFEASARFLAAVDEMLDSLLSLK